jgi:methylglutaconyl-CoA hydratase
MESELLVDVRAGIARLILNRVEKRNALTRELIERLQAEFERVRADSTVRLIALEANGLAFCAGMDLGEMQRRAADPRAAEQWREDSVVYGGLLRSIFEVPIPTVAVVQGPALAGGMGLVLACDLVLASDNAFFALPEPARGITAAMVTPLLLYRVGNGTATFLLLSGQRISASTARSMGVCHEVVGPELLASRRDEWFRTALSGSPAALAITKQHLQRCSRQEVGQRIEESIAVSAQARQTDEAREGLAAFLEKRPPRWQPE